MRLKLFLLLALTVGLSVFAQQHTGVRGVVVDASSGSPVAGAVVMLDQQGITTNTGPSGDFIINTARPGTDVLIVLGYGYSDMSVNVTLMAGQVRDLGTISLRGRNAEAEEADGEFRNDLVLSESQLEDEEGESQSVAILTSANDNPFYQAASYNFSLMRFRMRGYNTEYQSTSINGLNFNDAIRGRFNYSMIGGLNQAFRNKSIGMGLETTRFGFGSIGGATNITTYARNFAPGFRGSVAFTNANYKWRGMVTYSTGLMPNGWALAASVVGRYAGEGIVPGSFYKSFGYFLSAQKVFNDAHSLNITTFGAPTRRASNSAVVQEAYDLAGSNLYNANWGWQDGKKRNSRVVQSFDPTVLVNWIWKPNNTTTLNTGTAFHKSFYSSSALSWYNAPDPRPDYYRYLPSYITDEHAAELYTELWQNSDAVRQVNWNRMYQANALNNYLDTQNGTETGSTYMLERRHSNQAVWSLGTTLSKEFTKITQLFGGVNLSYTRASYYKTVDDLLGGKFWTDIDQYAERDFPSNPDLAQNDLNNPNRRVFKGDRFGYDYNINSWRAEAWKQFVFTLPKWDLSYALRATYTRFQRDGHMRNGRSPEHSYGEGAKHEYVNAAFKGSATYKIDGRNFITAHVYYGTHAPLPNNAYVSPRTKDDVIDGLESEAMWSGDISYTWNYRSFKGIITGYWTDQRHATERYSYYDDQYSTFMNYALTGVHKVYKGLEIGFKYKIIPSLTLSGAANIGRYQYKNRPRGIRSYENGTQADIYTTVYLKNFYVSGTPQQAYSLSLNWAAPKMWFFEINGAWMGDAYIDLSPVRHEVMDGLYTMASSEQDLTDMIKSISKQERLNNAFVLNASIGHVIYLNRRASLNINLNLNNILNNRKIMTGGYQQGRFDYRNFSTGKFPNKYYYAQGFKIFLNVGVRF